jgi:carotenoid cleavage dioxygenase-like enzyme
MGRINSCFSRREAIGMAGTALTGMRGILPSFAEVSAALRGAAQTVSWSSDKPALSRAFAPVFDERDDVDLSVEGEIPKGMRGVFMRNGPNPSFGPDPDYAYPFDGTGIVQALYLRGARA